ncbi:MAG TPA: ADP-ribosylglycohydrolase family protein [Acidimicrobiia bacterium]
MTEPLFSLVAGEGDGALLGLAAGDTASGAWKLGYSAITQQATIISYELIGHGQIDRTRFTDSVLELDGSQDEEPVFRAETPEFRSWLDGAALGSPVPDETPSLDPIGRSAPIGVFYRRDPETLYQEVFGLNRLFHNDAPSLLSGAIVAAAVAASCFGQVGRDLLLGVSESVEPAVNELSTGLVGLVDIDLIADAPARIAGLVESYGLRSGLEALDRVRVNGRVSSLDTTLAMLLVAAPTADRFHEPVVEGVKIGGANGGAAVGAILGARVGIRAWPWAFANDTWFAEIGRRLVRGPAEVRDLPIPYAVEQHLISGVRRDQ